MIAELQLATCIKLTLQRHHVHLALSTSEKMAYADIRNMYTISPQRSAFGIIHKTKENTYISYGAASLVSGYCC